MDTDGFRLRQKKREARGRGGREGIVSQLWITLTREGPPFLLFVGASARISPCFSRGYKWLRSTFHGVTELSGIAEADMNPLIAVSTLLFYLLTLRNDREGDLKKELKKKKKKANKKMWCTDIRAGGEGLNVCDRDLGR